MELDKLLSPIAIQKLNSFSSNANRTVLHPLDTERFYSFIIESHLENSPFKSETLEYWLSEEKRWPMDMAEKISEQYEVARDLLEYYDRKKLR
jgi:hypothetical protein